MYGVCVWVYIYGYVYFKRVHSNSVSLFGPKKKNLKKNKADSKESRQQRIKSSIGFRVKQTSEGNETSEQSEVYMSMYMMYVRCTLKLMFQAKEVLHHHPWRHTFIDIHIHIQTQMATEPRSRHVCAVTCV